jgi:hypothetical protein
MPTMNTLLVDSIVQLVENLSPEERDLVKYKLLHLVPAQDQVEHQVGTKELTLDERQNFLRQPLAVRQSILAQQAEDLLTHYNSSIEWRELMAGDIIDG